MPTALRSAHHLAHRLLVAGANRLPIAVAVHEGIAASRLLVVIEKKRLMCTTHSASLREQPNGWWI